MKKIFILMLLLQFAFAQKVEAIRGVWLTNVDSQVLDSKENIVEAVKLCSDLKINTICVVTWNKAMTSFPSKVAKSVTGYLIDPRWDGRDPLKELIEEAHKHNIKVIAWFEFGFSSSYNENGGIILKNKPDWAAKDSQGKLVKKNNFEWMNGFHPEVQQFLLDLIMEVVKNYDIDGIQGDDRLPAMPSTAGYDKYTVDLYKKTHKGKNPPKNYKDNEWIQWRCDILNNFMKRIYTEVKKYNPKVLVTMAPSIYPWAKEEYFQDWPTWVKNGWVDFISPQLYRDNIQAYQMVLKEIVQEQIDDENLNKFFPGLLIKVGNKYPSDDLVREMIEFNRKMGVNGEVFFFYEGLKKFKNTLLDIYKNDIVEFPSK
jgi:uncharacterized lipoprotein YddW (UPF0748 family)